MGSAYYIALEKEIDGLDTTIDGKAISKNIETLDETARKLGVRPLSEFFSMDNDAVADALGEDMANLEIPPMEQFSAEDGLKTVRALLPRPEAQPAIEDLQACERILKAAAEHGIGWHFQIDI
jgi:hypothetical protein